MSYTVNRQPHFKAQPMKDCTGTEIVEEWLYHMGVPEAEIHDLATTGAHCVPCMMPYITAFFMPRAKGDRPKVVPDGCVNFAFTGQFADTVRDTVFTTEYSVRTAMEAVYTLLNVDRGVPEVFGSVYDVRVLLDSTVISFDHRKTAEPEVSNNHGHFLQCPWLFSLPPSFYQCIGRVKVKLPKCRINGHKHRSE